MLLALLFIVYRFWRHSRAEVVPSTLGLASCIEHYRARLLRQRELSRDAWAFILPFVPGFGLIILGRAFEGRPTSQVAVLIAVAISVFAAVLWAIARGRRTNRTRNRRARGRVILFPPLPVYLSSNDPKTSGGDIRLHALVVGNR
jgi:hypothetical protein